MKRGAAIAVLIASFFAVTLYTTNGCGGTTPTEPVRLSQLSGMVIDEIDRRPIANVLVAVQQAGGVRQTALSGTDGRYAIGGLFPGDNVRVDATVTGYRPFTTTARLNEGANTLDILLPRQP